MNHNLVSLKKTMNFSQICLAKKALLIENSICVREFHIKLLQHIGYQVDTAENGQHLIAKLEADHAYDLIMVDIELPDMSAIEMVAKVRQYEQHNRLPHIIVLTTACVSSQILTACFAAGIGRIVKKPLSLCYFPEILEAEY